MSKRAYTNFNAITQSKAIGLMSGCFIRRCGLCLRGAVPYPTASNFSEQDPPRISGLRIKLIECAYSAWWLEHEPIHFSRDASSDRRLRRLEHKGLFGDIPDDATNGSNHAGIRQSGLKTLRTQSPPEILFAIPGRLPNLENNSEAHYDREIMSNGRASH